MTLAPEQVLKQYWGYDSFRPMQSEIIESVLDGHDTLALLPTGGGKSICFQVPALCRPGICVVVSPLIALMKDQVQNLEKRNISAVAIFSGMNSRDIDRVLDNCVYGSIKFLYLSPERLLTDIAVERIRRMNVSLFAVDEAHCISQWGYDFRPPYLQISEIRELHPNVPVLALTATATEKVVDDIQEKLAFRSKKVFRQGFLRPNLSYSVLHEEGKEQKLFNILQKVPGTSVVYTRNRRKTQEIALALQRSGISADYYHAGLDHDSRTQKQEAWVAGRIRVIVATNAFGMGIDKPDVRSVIHMDVPDSLEAYFQEAGRAGRDGNKSFAVLLWNQNDENALLRQLEVSFPTLATLRQVYQALCNYFQVAVGPAPADSFDFDLLAFAKTYQLDLITTLHAVKVLEQEGWITLSEAVFLPSTIQFTAERDQLYDFQLRHPEADKLVKLILRAHMGVFQQPVGIREETFASILRTDLATVQGLLQHIHQNGLAVYNARKDMPQLTFLQNRVEARDLTINLQGYNFRKERYSTNVKNVIAYAKHKICRSKQLIEYFGEQDAQNCGMCDVCLGRHRRDITAEDYERYKKKVTTLLSHQQLSLQDLLSSFAPNRHERLLTALHHMFEEGVLLKNSDKISLP